MATESKRENPKNKVTRRQFIKATASAGAFSVLGGSLLPGRASALPVRKPPRVRIPNPFVNAQGQPILVSVEGNDFPTMLDAGLQALGGLDKLFTDNQDVLIKPNCNSIDTFPVVTSGASVAALIQALEGVTNGAIRVGDQGWNPTEQVYISSGIETAVNQTNAELLTFSVTDCYNVRHPSWGDTKPNYLVFEEAYDASVIINMPCLKRHWLGRMTSGLKNHVGLIPGEGGGAMRAYLHSMSGTPLLEEIAEIACLINPELTIVDARSILAGNGPLPTQVGAYYIDDVNRVILCGDTVASDIYCANLLASLDPAFSASMIDPTVARAALRGMGVASLNGVEIVEISTTDVEKEDVQSPTGFRLSQNYPNPFNASTKIRFVNDEKARVRLEVFDLSGRSVGKLVDDVKPRGDYTVAFDAGNLPSGRYVYRLQVGESTLSKTMMLAR